jgi:ADP-heptose:LPS heptosyltransferase
MIFKVRSRKHKQLIRNADSARDAREYRRAALLYEKALRLVPNNAAIHIQCGHMHKEAGDLANAEPHYLRAKLLTPDDPDLALQLGHFYKVAGRPLEAELSYKRAIELDPTRAEPAIQLAILYRSGWRNDAPSETDWLVPEVAPVPKQTRLRTHDEEISIQQLGRRERTSWGGTWNTVRCVEAIRGFCISAVIITELRARLNGVQFYSGSLQGFPLKYESDDLNKRKYVFNIWHDFSGYVSGIYTIELQFINNKNSIILTHKEQIVIAPSVSENDYPNSDRLVSISALDPRSIEEQINSRPSIIRLAKRRYFATPPRNVLILRVDQIGDLVVSVPAIRRLRELLPKARFIGLLSVANAELARTLDLFDEVISIDFPDDEWERRRVMSVDQQHELRRRLEPFKFDVAIDLSFSDVSRPLLLFSGAPYLLGFKDDRCPWLSAYIEGITRDPVNGSFDIPHSSQVLGLVEWFGAILSDHSPIIHRLDLTKDRLLPYGLSAGDRFTVLHTGARLKFSQWPHYHKLASMILDKTDLKVVMMSDDPLIRSNLPPELAGSDRFQLLDKRLPFDEFDALLSFCTVFVGNDSGPSHLASLRGANVVNVYLARHNWNEWGHENKGYIITRRVPCAGCNIFHDPEECGKDFACIVHITPEEVFRTLMEFV